MDSIDDQWGWVSSPQAQQSHNPRLSMAITITVAQTVSNDVFSRIVALAQVLRQSDPNFEGLTISVSRGDETLVTDTDDKLRETLLHLLVEDELAAGSEPSLHTLHFPRNDPPGMSGRP